MIILKFLGYDDSMIAFKSYIYIRYIYIYKYLIFSFIEIISNF